MVGGGGGEVVGPQMNKFGHVSSDNVRGGVRSPDLMSGGGVPGLMFGGGGRSHMSPGLIPEVGGGGRVPYHLTYSMIHVTYLGQTDAYENITFPELRLQAVTIPGMTRNWNSLFVTYYSCLLWLSPLPPPAPPRVEWCINGRSVTRKQKRLSLVWTWGRGPGSV